MPQSVMLLVLAILTSAGSVQAAEIQYQVVPDFVQLPDGMELGACAAVSVDEEGNIFLFHRGEHPIVCLDKNGKYLRAWGDREIDTAHGLRIDPAGHLWVTDMAAHRVLKFDRQGKLSMELGTGKPGDGNDQFNKPTDVAFGADGAFYVSDGYGNSRVLKFSPNGTLIGKWGSRGKLAGEFNLPHSILVDQQGRVLVGDRENDRIQVFDADGKQLAIWPGFAPYGMAFSPEGELYVADGRANQVLRLDSAGKVVQRIGSAGSQPGEFRMPHMLGFDAQGNLYVAEVNGRQLQKFERK